MNIQRTCLVEPTCVRRRCWLLIGCGVVTCQPVASAGQSRNYTDYFSLDLLKQNLLSGPQPGSTDAPDGSLRIIRQKRRLIPDLYSKHMEMNVKGCSDDM